eukprot:gene26792-14493_t
MCAITAHLSSKTVADRARNYHTHTTHRGVCGVYHTLITGCGERLCAGRPLLEHFHNVVVFGDLNYRIAEKGQQGLGQEVIFDMLRNRPQDLWALDPLAGEVREGRAFGGFREPAHLPNFYPTYKKRTRRPVPINRSNPAWVGEVYHVQFKEPFYKGGRVRMRIPSFTD